MIKIENVETVGWEHAIRGMRNPMNSWEKSDSKQGSSYDYEFCDWIPSFEIGANDLKLAKQLCKAGTDHRKFMRMITVYADITAPRYWWTEYDTYKIGTVANSCSTMHKIADKKFDIDDFSCENLFGIGYKAKPKDMPVYYETNGNKVRYVAGSILSDVICSLNFYREKFNETKDKRYWWQMIQLLPQSYNQKRTVMLNYEVLTNMYKSRKNHKLDEWRTFCKWIEGLPYSELITGDDENDSKNN